MNGSCKTVRDSDKLLEVVDLDVSFFTADGEVKAVNGISYYVRLGEVVAIVGESGCGKSVSQLTALGLIQSPPGKILNGHIFFEGRDLLKYDAKSKEMRDIRGAKISMVFQEPMTSLNPVLTVGAQISEVIRVHSGVGKKESWDRGIRALERVGIPDAAQRMKNYPFQMSGGMRQRAMIATAIACNSRLMIADEPTTALDVTTQAQVMELLMSLVHETGMSLVMVTHNLGLVTRYAQRIYVMYAGRIVESGTAEELLTDPRHPYTVGLLSCVPKLDDAKDRDLVPIDGSPPNLLELPSTCPFIPRCHYAKDRCHNSSIPELRRLNANGHSVACHLKIAREGK